MAQFRAYRNHRRSRDRVPYLLDVQSDLFDLGTRLIAPLVLERHFTGRMARLHPVLTVEQCRVVMSAADLVALPVHDLRDEVADLSAARQDILAAVDFLISGY
ncbi:CcdB family protein [Solimonas soli]|uniref:CcdB family protein n=1 Tax=Solimonas soli TaxID=413479 RepID=UPI0004828272|nr:CcdB family protein [Solimonas soli]